MRNITTPLQVTYLPNSSLLHLLQLLDTSTIPRLRTTASELDLRLQPVVSLRGGSGGEQDIHDHEEELALQAHFLRLQNPQDFGIYVSSWCQEAGYYYRMGLASMSRRLLPRRWIEPINAGLSYECFISSLTATQTDRFDKLFGPAPGSNLPWAPRARVAFLHSLCAKIRAKFLDALKGSIFLKMTGFKGMIEGETAPSVMLSLLLSTAEQFVQLIPTYH